MVYLDRRGTARRWMFAGAAALIAATLVDGQGRAYGQNYSVLKPNEQHAALRGRAASILRQPSAPSADDLETLTNFFTYYYRSMTGKAPAQLAALGKVRQDLFRQFLNLPNGSQAARDHVLDLTLKAMTAFAKGNFHPAVRYNAALILGQLDATPAGTGAGAAAPKPLPASTAALVELLEGGQANPAAIPSSVTVGVLVALERQTQLGVDPQYADRITQGALAVAARDERPEDVSARVFDWMRALAARVLANQHAKGVTPPVHTALVKLLTDKKMNLDDRCAVAESFTTTMYQGAQGVNIDEAVSALGSLARDVMADEAEAARKYQSELVPDSELRSGAFGGEFGRGGGYGGEFGGGYGGGRYGGEFGRGGYGGDPLQDLQNQGPSYEKRRMLDRVFALSQCGKALAGAGSDEVKNRLKELVTAMDRVGNQAASRDATDVTVANGVIELAADVNRVVKSWTPAAEPAEAPDDELQIDEPAEAAPGN